MSGGVNERRAALAALACVLVAPGPGGAGPDYAWRVIGDVIL